MREDFDLCGTVHVQRAGKGRRENLAEVSDSPTSHA